MVFTYPEPRDWCTSSYDCMAYQELDDIVGVALTVTNITSLQTIQNDVSVWLEAVRQHVHVRKIVDLSLGTD